MTAGDEATWADAPVFAAVVAGDAAGGVVVTRTAAATENGHVASAGRTFELVDVAAVADSMGVERSEIETVTEDVDSAAAVVAFDAETAAAAVSAVEVVDAANAIDADVVVEIVAAAVAAAAYAFAAEVAAARLVARPAGTDVVASALGAVIVAAGSAKQHYRFAAKPLTQLQSAVAVACRADFGAMHAAIAVFEGQGHPIVAQVLPYPLDG